MLNIEQRLMVKFAADYQHLTLIQKVEVFEYALSMTSGHDLGKVLWLKSPNAEVWLDRRTNYTRSLAVMSMVGYILGLGDRHPCNLMLDRNSGKIIHIDFGDCFEVAMHREKFPEKIPFRLTRMLVNAMEVSGIEGTFRSTCESVMGVLRKNKNSVMAVLEAFVYDPLINWRLLDTNRKNKVLSEEKKDETTTKKRDSFGDERDREKKEEIRRAEEGIEPEHEELNQKAVSAISRVESKLNGTDFDDAKKKTVLEQIQRLIMEATSHQNLCQSYIGWCPFW